MKTEVKLFKPLRNFFVKIEINITYVKEKSLTWLKKRQLKNELVTQISEICCDFSVIKYSMVSLEKFKSFMFILTTLDIKLFVTFLKPNVNSICETKSCIWFLRFYFQNKAEFQRGMTHIY